MNPSLQASRAWTLPLLAAVAAATLATSSPAAWAEAAPAAAATAEERHALAGSYLLSDGRTLVVAQRGRQLLLTLDTQERPLQRVSAARLRSTDGRLELDFALRANGLVDGVTLRQRGG